jgi:glycosyltransferase involved in cell wall biosynthesis
MIWYPVEDIGNHYINIPVQKKMLVPNIPKLSQFKNLESNNIHKKNQFIYLGTMVEDRGIMELIKAFEIFAGSNSNYKLLLLGPFKSEKYKTKVYNYVNSLSIKDSIIFKIVPYNEVPKYLEESKVGLLNFLPLPNNIHGLPNKLFEYLAFGLPVIASDFPNYRNIIVKENVGFCVNPTIPEEIASAMNKIMNDVELRDKQSRKGKLLVKNSYNWDIKGREIINKIDDILHEN